MTAVKGPHVHEKLGGVIEENQKSSSSIPNAESVLDARFIQEMSKKARSEAGIRSQFLSTPATCHLPMNAACSPSDGRTVVDIKNVAIVQCQAVDIAACRQNSPR